MPPEYRPIKQKLMDKKRLASEQIGVIQTFFDRLKVTIRTHRIQHENIYNFDETNFQPGRGKSQTVVTRHPERAFHSS
jgi:hypothetical protein